MTKERRGGGLYRHNGKTQTTFLPVFNANGFVAHGSAMSACRKMWKTLWNDIRLPWIISFSISLTFLIHLWYIFIFDCVSSLEICSFCKEWFLLIHTKWRPAPFWIVNEATFLRRSFPEIPMKCYLIMTRLQYYVMAFRILRTWFRCSRLAVNFYHRKKKRKEKKVIDGHWESKLSLTKCW